MRLFIIVFITTAILQEYSQAQNTIMQMDASLGVNYIVTNPQGQKSGVDPRGAATHKQWKWFREIPHANYSFMSVGDLDSNKTADDVSMEFVYQFNPPEGDGVYMVQVFGNELDVFSLCISVDPLRNTTLQDFSDEIEDIPIDKDSR